MTALLLTTTGCPDDDDPTEWTLAADGLDEALLGVHGTSENDVWAVGSDRGAGPIVLRYDGTAWTRLPTGTRGDLWWVHAIPGGPVYLAGANATILRYDGTSFTRMRTPGVATHTIYGVWARSASEVYAVGSLAGSRDGFLWRFDGTEWSNVDLPASTPKNARGNVPGFFKVWGDAEHLWIAGGDGLLLERAIDGTFTTIETGTDQTLFTVHAEDGNVAAVGGASNGVLVGGQGDVVTDQTPEACPLLQGVCLTSRGGFATGFEGTVYERRGARWVELVHDLPVDVESLHAAWVDPTGTLFAVGGNVLTPNLTNGAILTYGREIGRYTRPVPDDGGMPDSEMPQVVCPEAQIDPVPTGTIARRWNEANLNAIRRAVPRPGVHARNLFHNAVAMYDAWAAYDATADGYVVTEKLTAADVDAARTEAISYASYRLLSHRYSFENGGPVSLACFDALMDRLGFEPEDTTTTGDSPRALGNRIGAAIVAEFADDGANEGENYRDQTGYEFVNPPLVVDQPGAPLNDWLKWQPLNLAVAVTQNGIVTDAGVQGYIGPNWGGVTPFALRRTGAGVPYFDEEGLVDDDELVDATVEMIQLSAILDPDDETMVDLSPGVFGNNPLGTDRRPREQPRHRRALRAERGAARRLRPRHRRALGGWPAERDPARALEHPREPRERLPARRAPALRRRRRGRSPRVGREDPLRGQRCHPRRGHRGVGAEAGAQRGAPDQPRALHGGPGSAQRCERAELRRGRAPARAWSHRAGHRGEQRGGRTARAPRALPRSGRDPELARRAW
ncbi:MAG: hypothetical protein MUE69_15255 [Myxococcota bacterium]|nr:hypothetical protein [Myxococcota bacterium]